MGNIIGMLVSLALSNQVHTTLTPLLTNNSQVLAQIVQAINTAARHPDAFGQGVGFFVDVAEFLYKETVEKK
jgi:hypothetical protein